MVDMNSLTRHPDRATSIHGSVAPPASPSTSRPAAPAVEIVIPVHNEQLALENGVRTLHAHLNQTFAFSFRVTIADNASTDATLDVARTLAQELDGVEVLYLDRKGRGHALRCAWSRSDATVLAYMDVDLSTDLAALDELLTPLLEGRGDLAIGSRLAAGAEVTRGLRREAISRTYNLLLHALLGVTFSDAQCGFKAGRREVVQALLDDVHDDAWFFDTELLYLAQKRKLAIHEVPVRWVEDLDSRVQIVATAREDLRGVMRLRAAARLGDEHAPRDRRRGSRTRLPWLRLGRLRSRSTGLPT
jgi:glycosyltransferase involved in cell wall biosynthesis